MENKNKRPYRVIDITKIIRRLPLIFLAIFVIIYSFSLIKSYSKDISYDVFAANVNAGKYKEIVGTTVNGATKIEAITNEGEKQGITLYNNEVEKLKSTEPNFASKLKLDTVVADSMGNGTMMLYFGVILIIMFVGFMMFLRRLAQPPRGQMEFGKSKAKLFDVKTKNVTFKDVAGSEEEKQALSEIVDYLKDSAKFTKMGARIPKGVLMVGPPGTGKTLLARAVAGEANVPFYSISGSDFLEMFVGVGASRVRDLFSEAKKHAPAIIFIDEIDAIGRARGAGFGGGHDEREQTLNQILVEMDGFEGNTGVIMMAATNRPDILDPALLRPGRFDRRIRINPPDAKEREEILKIHTRKKPLGSDVDLSVIAKSTIGFTGAELENLTNEAALIAVKKGQDYINSNDFEEAGNIIRFGPEKKNMVITEKARKLTAYHEAGHAIVSKALPGYYPVNEISIVPRGGGAGGYTSYLPTEERLYVAKKDLIDELSTLLGGRCAEMLVLGDISTGAKNDIDRASQISRAMVLEYGMSDKIGNVTFPESEDVFMAKGMNKYHASENMGNLIDSEVKNLIDTAYDKSKAILNENLTLLHKLAQTLLEKEVIKGYEFEYLYRHGELKEDFTPEEIQELNNELYHGKEITL